MWQSGIDDGGIQDTDERTKDGRDQHPPFIVAACTPCEWTCDPSSRHMKMGTHALFLSFFRSAPPIVYDPILRKWEEPQGKRTVCSKYLLCSFRIRADHFRLYQSLPSSLLAMLE